MVTQKARRRSPWVDLGAIVWLTMLGVTNNISENVGLLPGVFYNKFPPWVMTLNPINRSKSGILNQPIGSSESMLQGEENADRIKPLLTPSSSTASLGSFHKNDSVSKIDMLLTKRKEAVKKKRRPRRGEDFKFTKALVKLLSFLGLSCILVFFYNFMSLGNPLGAFLYSGLLAGYVYDNEAAKQQGMNLLNSGVSCLGPNCFRLSFLVLAGVCGVGSILNIILTMRIRPVYQILYSRGSFRLPQNSDH
ncbi:hypothetical protein PVL29_027143 [Vitis rotundifolia]|uniref:Transmembrane protein n=1 Tax=Vitis rotundifolia TaxID=103349 RepID=A0AA38YIE8_VITRO|nr:hypothetical protein PVL29_027143 [Vitis rotundifolia]